MANVRKKISELTALTSASLDTTIVGVDNGTTYKIELDTLADAVTSRVNILDRNRLSSLESVTSSFETKGRSVISSSAQITGLGFISSSTTIPTGTISSSAQITSFGFISSSATIPAGTISSSAQITTLGFISSSTDITSLNSFTSSQSSLNTAFTNGISARLQTSSFNEYTASQSTSSLVNRLNAIESVSGSWITESETGSLQTSITNLNTFTASVSTASLVTSISNLNSATSSYLTSLSGAISSSSQLTSSFDTRYVASGSISAVPAGTISGSAQITAFGFISSSTTIDTGSLVTTSSFNSYTASLNAFSSSLSVTANSSTKILDAYYTNAAAWSGSYSGNGGTVKVEANFALYSTSIGTKTFTLFRNGIAVDSGSFYFNNTGVHATMPTLYYIGTNETGTNTYSVGHNAVSDAGDSCNIVVTETFNTLNAGLISGSSQLTSAFPSKTTGTWSVPAGASTQSFTVEAGASYTMWVNGNIPNGIITWNATVTTANTNVPVVGSQHGWYYTAGNALVLTSMPDQITGTNGSIVTTPTSYAPNTSNVFKFGITNNSGTSQTINYGYIKLS